MVINNSIDALNIFVKAVQEHAKAISDGDYKIANKKFDLAINAIKFLIQQKSVDMLIQLLSHEEFSIQRWAATYLLPYKEEIAKKKLQELAEQNINHISFECKITLEEWNSGSLNFDYLND